MTNSRCIDKRIRVTKIMNTYIGGSKRNESQFLHDQLGKEGRVKEQWFSPEVQEMVFEVVLKDGIRCDFFREEIEIL